MLQWIIMLSKDSLCEWWMTTCEIFSYLLCSASISILFGVMVSLFQCLPLSFILAAGNNLTKCFWELSQGAATQRSPENRKVSLFSCVCVYVFMCVCVREREKGREGGGERERGKVSTTKRTCSTGQLPWRQTSVKRHLHRNSPRVGEILWEKAKPFNMLELCRTNLNAA